MIFVTTGTQLPFDRLLKQVEIWAVKNPNVEIVAQTCKSNLIFTQLENHDFLTPHQYAEYISQANVVVGHAGMGTIISAYELDIPVILMPRIASLNEHRNDHQLATAKKFKDAPGIYIAKTDEELLTLLDKVDLLSPPGERVLINRQQIISFLQEEINL